MKRRIISMLLVLVLCLSLVPVAATADTGGTVYVCYADGWGYTYAEALRPTLSLYEDGSFTLNANFGTNMVMISGSYNSDNIDGTTYLWCTPSSKPSGYEIYDSYSFIVGTNGDLYKSDGGVGITPVESVFTKTNGTPAAQTTTGTDTSFSDVASDAWYASSVSAAVDAGLINGKSAGFFAPDDNLTIAECLKLAATTHQYLTGTDYEFESTDVWYKTYINYLEYVDCMTYFDIHTSYTDNATRSEFAQIMSEILVTFTEAELNKNTVNSGDIPDVSFDMYPYDSVYDMYRAGIMVGSDSEGTFNSFSNILRCEAAVLIHRMIDASQRQSF